PALAEPLSVLHRGVHETLARRLHPVGPVPRSGGFYAQLNALAQRPLCGSNSLTGPSHRRFKETINDLRNRPRERPICRLPGPRRRDISRHGKQKGNAQICSFCAGGSAANEHAEKIRLYLSTAWPLPP